MRLTCPNCGAQYNVPAAVIPDEGRNVQCSSCASTWFQEGAGAQASDTGGDTDQTHDHSGDAGSDFADPREMASVPDDVAARSANSETAREWDEARQAMEEDDTPADDLDDWNDDDDELSDEPLSHGNAAPSPHDRFEALEEELAAGGELPRRAAAGRGPDEDTVVAWPDDNSLEQNGWNMDGSLTRSNALVEGRDDDDEWDEAVEEPEWEEDAVEETQAAGAASTARGEWDDDEDDANDDDWGDDDNDFADLPAASRAQASRTAAAAAAAGAAAGAAGAGSRRPLDQSIAEILREEAELEEELRQAEAEQDGSGHDRQSGNVDSAIAATGMVHPSDRGKRGDRLPDIDEINSSLRPGDEDDYDDSDPAGRFEDLSRKMNKQRSNFGQGFMLSVVVAVSMFTIYVFAPQIIGLLPESDTLLSVYVTSVDQGRTWLDRQFIDLTQR